VDFQLLVKKNGIFPTSITKIQKPKDGRPTSKKVVSTLINAINPVTVYPPLAKPLTPVYTKGGLGGIYRHLAQLSGLGNGTAAVKMINPPRSPFFKGGRLGG
jgi:hypothetical protein